MSETIQSVLAGYFRHQAAWRQRKYQQGVKLQDEDVREKCSAQCLEALATLVEKLPDSDPGIKTLAAFGWPVECFRHGAGSESLNTTRLVGYRGTHLKPIYRPTESWDLERAWSAWVTAAERDRDAMERVLLILGDLLDDSSRSRLRSALDKLRASKQAA